MLKRHKLTANDITVLKRQLVKIRKELEHKYMNNVLSGKCIEASDELVERLIRLGYDAEAYQCWCLYELFESCMDYCYEEHWIVMVQFSDKRVYIDPTISQFQWAFSRDIGKVYIGMTLPKFLLARKPGRDTLKKCGWTDWYNTGNYINNFEYY